jgi:hypothetical protein
MILLALFFTSCSNAVYVYQNGTTYNDYEVANNYRIKNATKRPKVHYNKPPKWKKISYKQRYN